MEQMTSRERVMASILHQPVDRLAMDFWGVSEITERLMKHFHAYSWPELSRAMNIDKIIQVGPRLKEGRPNMLGIPMKQIPIPNGQGYYEEPVCFPLGNCESIDDILDSGYEFPSVEMYDYSVIKKQCDEAEGFAIEGGYISLTYFYEMLRGTENMLLDMALNPELAEYILFRLEEFSYEHTRRILEAADGRIDLSQVTDDLGTQNSLLMSMDMVRHFLESSYQKNIAMIKEYGSHIFHHDDGAMTAALPWLTELGIEVLNPLQWHLPNWDLYELKKEYGNRLCFHGGIDNQYILPFGTREEIREEVRVCVEALFSDKTGYILAPCHNIQANTPIENVLEMYQAARECVVY